MEVTTGFGEELTSLGEQALLAIYHAKQEHTWTETIIGEIEDALDRAGLRSRIAITPAICFLDITGFTRMTEERGDEAAAELAMRLTPLVQRPSDRHGGKVVKWLGDGVMFHFREPRPVPSWPRSRCSRPSRQPACLGRTSACTRAGRVPGRRLLRPNGQRRGEDRGPRGGGPGARDPGVVDRPSGPWRSSRSGRSS